MSCIVWVYRLLVPGNIKIRKPSYSLNQKVSQQERASTQLPVSHGSVTPEYGGKHGVSSRFHDGEVLLTTGQRLKAESLQGRIPEMPFKCDDGFNLI